MVFVWRSADIAGSRYENVWMHTKTAPSKPKAAAWVAEWGMRAVGGSASCYDGAAVDSKGGDSMEASDVLSIGDIRAMVLPLLPEYDMRAASLFGSYARGQADEASDIDLLLEGNPGFRALNVFGVAEDLHRLSGKRVDVFEMSELDAGPFRDAVLRDAVRL